MELFANSMLAGASRLNPPLAMRTRHLAIWALAVIAMALACGLIVVSGSPSIRLAIAVATTVTLLALFDWRPAAGVMSLLVYVSLVALFRRMLIPAVGWSINDPLLLVAPLVASVLVVRLFVVDRRQIAGDRLSYLVCAALALIVLASVNPRNGSLAVGLGGLLFMAMPMLWFFIARELIDRRTLDRLFALIIALAVAIATYGFYQSLAGLPSWDSAWAEIAGYSSLYLERGVTNTFGTFASTAEYTLFMGVAIAGAVAFALHGRAVALLALPILSPAIFLSSNRSGFVFALLAVTVMLTLRFVRPRFVPGALIVFVALVAFASPLIMSALQSGAASTGNARVEYQLSGLGDPFNREQSTVTLHWQLFVDGVRQGLTDPVGRGSGVTNASIRRLGAGGENAAGYSNTEIDISNSFVSLGLIGGLVYLALVVTAFAFAFRGYLRQRDAVSLAVIGALIATLGHWLSGGHYAVTPFIWILLGVTAALRPAPPAPPASRA